MNTRVRGSAGLLRLRRTSRSMSRWFVTALLLLALLPAALWAATTGGVQSRPQATAEQIKWWRDARFGMFVHWGPVSLKGTEISWSRAKWGGRNLETGGGWIPVEEYDNLYKQFNPVKFDPDEWVRVAKAAGMKYLVFTTKHHDGFCEFDSKLTDYKITNSPYGKDIVGQLARACHNAKLRLGFYYSPPDWHHPDYFTANHARYIEYMHGQLRELCTNYGKVDIIWFDGLFSTAEDLDSPRMIDMVRRLQPGVLVNNRAGMPADFGTPEQEIGGFDNTRPWESCITIGDQWAWKPNDNIKSLKGCIDTLARCAGGDGNLLLNVGPMPDGRIEDRQVARLKEIGAWLKENGESIYATRGGPFAPDRELASTYRGNTVYLHILNWPDGHEKIELPGIGKRVVSGKLMTGKKVKVEQSDNGLSVSVSPECRNALDTIVVLELDGPASEIRPVRRPSIVTGKPARASNVHGSDYANWGPAKAFDNDLGARWATDTGVRSAWLEVDAGRFVSVTEARISEAIPRVQRFELQYMEGGEWKTFYSGSTIGHDFAAKFNRVTARRFRLNILDATDGPTIWEFELLGGRR